MASFGYYKDRQPPKILRLLQNRKIAIIGGIFGLMILLLAFSNKGFIPRIRLTAERNALVERVRALELENQRLRFEEKNLTSDLCTIEHVAREKHGMVLPGEIVYRVREIKK